MAEPQGWERLSPGDRFEGRSERGTVLINFETGACAEGYDRDGWGQAPGGLLIEDAALGLVRLPRSCFDASE
ncbi:MAG: hypothetical protein AAFR17_00550 [Pseudomonadota bacterium]